MAITHNAGRQIQPLYISAYNKNFTLLESSQHTPARPSGRSSINMELHEEDTVMLTVGTGNNFINFSFLRLVKGTFWKFNLNIF